MLILYYHLTAAVSRLQFDVDPPPTPLMTLLSRIRQSSEQFPAPYIMWTLFFSAVVATVTMMAVCPDYERQQRNGYDIMDDE